jgi:hypothetical protein
MALCLDPRMKTTGFHSIIEYLYETLDFDESVMSKEFRIKNIKEKTAKTLSEMYNLYAFESFCPSRTNSTGQEEALSSSSQFQPARKSSSSISSSSSSKHFSPWGLLKQKKKVKISYNEMSIYDMQSLVEDGSQSFDILV